MSQKTDTVVARTIGIDTGKNTLRLIGLDAICRHAGLDPDQADLVKLRSEMRAAPAAPPIWGECHA